MTGHGQREPGLFRAVCFQSTLFPGLRAPRTSMNRQGQVALSWAPGRWLTNLPQRPGHCSRAWQAPPNNGAGREAAISHVADRTRAHPPVEPRDPANSRSHTRRPGCRAVARHCAHHQCPVRAPSRLRPGPVGKSPLGAPTARGLCLLLRAHSTRGPSPAPQAVPRPQPSYLGVLLARGLVLLLFGGLRSLRRLLRG